MIGQNYQKTAFTRRNLELNRDGLPTRIFTAAKLQEYD